MVAIRPMNDPAIAQKGNTMPAMTKPRSKLTMTGTAGRKLSVLVVRSLNGRGKMLIGSGRNAPVIAGSAA